MKRIGGGDDTSYNVDEWTSIELFGWWPYIYSSKYHPFHQEAVSPKNSERDIRNTITRVLIMNLWSLTQLFSIHDLPYELVIYTFIHMV